MLSQENFDQLMSWLIVRGTEYGLQVASGILILALGWVVAGWAASRFQKAAFRTPRIDPTITPVLAKTLRILILLLTVLMVMTQFGLNIMSLIALLGAAGLAVGLALQGTLTNVASGIMLLSFRPFEAGNLVEVGGTIAVVDEIGLMMTRLHTPDNIFLSMPNSAIWGKPIRNFSRNPKRRIDMVFGIGYEDDMETAVRTIEEILTAEPRVLDDPAPMVAVAELADSSVNIYARPWVKSEDFLATKLALTRRVKERFDEAGVSIPFPQRDVHVFQEAPSPTQEKVKAV